MKRSKRITLVLMGTAGLVSLVACDEQPAVDEASFFKSEAECSVNNDATDCRDAFETARKEHWRTAPSFTSQESCEAQFGAQNCVQTASQPGTAQTPVAAPAATAGGSGLGVSSWFIPALAGYFIGRTTGGLSAMPYYQDVNKRAFMAGQPCNAPGQAVTSPSAACPQPSRWASSTSTGASTSFRSASSSSYGRWGSSSSSSHSSSTSRGGFGGSASSHSSGSGS